MSKVNEILQAARVRAEQLALPYSGALTPEEAHFLQQHLPQAILLDVRSHAECQLVGMPPQAQNIEWRTFPGMQPNPHFLAQLKQQIDQEAVLMLLCRSGVRSDEVARLVAAEGYSEVYNVLEGFEGEKDAAGHRGCVNGWQVRQLPWQQG